MGKGSGKMKKYLVLLTVFLLVFSSLGSVVSASSDNHNVKEEMIEESFKSAIEEAKGDNKVELENDFNKYKNLSDRDKEKFVEYMFNEEISGTVLESLEEIKDGEKIEFLEGDIEVSMSSEDTPNEELKQSVSAIAPTASTAATQNRRATYTKTVKFLGLSVLEVKAYVQYTHNGSKVTGTYGCDAFTNRNLNPTLSSDWGKCTRTYNSSQAWATARVTWNFIHKSLGIVYQSHLVKVWGNHKNEAGGSVTKL